MRTLLNPDFSVIFGSGFPSVWIEKKRDATTGKTNLYFDYPKSRILPNEEYVDKFGGVMKISYTRT